MAGDYPDDTFTEADVLLALDQAGLKYVNKGPRYILSQCPTHEDKHPSAQIFKDDWFVDCRAGCGRYHITKAFPELRENRGNTNLSPSYDRKSSRSNRKDVQRMSERVYTQYDLMEEWLKMPMIPREHGDFKNMPLDHLDDMGWRWDASQNAYFIPYFNRPKDKIPFAQYRYLNGDVRFRFLKDAKPTMYGTWNLDPETPILFLVEGTSDAAVLDFCAVPWIAAPSAASGELVKLLAGWCSENGIQLVYAGDNDDAGDKLKDALASVMAFRTCQPPKQYKDWGDFFVAEGVDAVTARTNPELGIVTYEPTENDPQTQAVLDIFPGATVLPIERDVAPKRKGATHNQGSH